MSLFDVPKQSNEKVSNFAQFKMAFTAVLIFIELLNPVCELIMTWLSEPSGNP